MEKAPAAVVGIAKQMWDVLTVQLLGFSSWLSTNWSDVRWRVTGPTWWCSYLLFACWLVNINNHPKSMLTPTRVKINEGSGESWRPAVCLLLLCVEVESRTLPLQQSFKLNIFCLGLCSGWVILIMIIVKHKCWDAENCIYHVICDCADMSKACTSSQIWNSANYFTPLICPIT